MIRRLLGTVAFVVFVVAIVLYASGAFDRAKIPPGKVAAPDGHLAAPARTATVRRETAAVHEDAVGTVESRMSVGVAAQVTGRILSVAAEAGAAVRKGEILVTLDDREMASRVAQAREGLSAAESARERALQAKTRAEALLGQAQSTHARIEGLLKGNAATPEQMEAAEAALRSAQAGVDEAIASIGASTAHIEQARQVVLEAEIALGHARILSPIDGVVSERDTEPGDLAWPGRTLLVVLDPGQLRLEALVREGLVAGLAVGQEYDVQLPAARRTLRGRLAEVIPNADPKSRTFRVRIDFDAVPGVYPGMFGRLRLPLGEREVLAVPEAAIERVGQLEMVVAKDSDGWSRRLVTTGVALPGERVEVLSGLAEGDVVGVPGAD